MTGKRHILLIENSENAIKFFSDALEESGVSFSLSSARTIQQAFIMLKNSTADIAFVNVNMAMEYNIDFLKKMKLLFCHSFYFLFKHQGQASANLRPKTYIIMKNHTSFLQLKKTFLVVALATSSVFFYSCSKQGLSTPATQQTVASQDEQDAITRTTPAPGNYKVNLYIDDNDTSTRIFRGYIFNFSNNGKLTATVSNVTYRGTWETKDGGTELHLRIEGTEALEKIDKSWDVRGMTNTLITLTDNDPGEITKLVFKKIL